MARTAPGTHLATSQHPVASLPDVWQTLVCGEARDSLCGLLASRPLPWSAIFFLGLVGTALPYWLQLSANRVLRSSLVSAYYTLQPLAAAMVVSLIVLFSPPPHLGVVPAGGVAALGGVGLVVGLCLVLRCEAGVPLAVQPGGARGLLPEGTARSSDVSTGAGAAGEAGAPGPVATAAASTASCEIELGDRNERV